VSDAQTRRRGIRATGKREAIRNQMVALYGRSCWLCGRGIADGDIISIDHVRPLSKGGSNKIHNLRPSHVRCNQKRGCNGVPTLLLTADMIFKEPMEQRAAPRIVPARTLERA
jgi:hypothetical protein